MKKIVSFLWFTLPALIYAQSTPPKEFLPVKEISSVIRDYGDTINFEGYPSNTVITDEYWSNGAIFSGYDGSGNPVTYDYGLSVYTSVLHSDDWYNPLRLRFVEESDSSLVKPISYLSFFNPVSSEIDYIKVVVYNVNDNPIYTYMSTSPEWVSIDLGGNTGSYVVFDDSAFTAYVIDNISFEPGGKPTGIKNPETTSSMSTVYPNPVDESFSILVNSSVTLRDARLYIYNVAGMPVTDLEDFNSNSIVLKKKDFSSGIYSYVIKDDDTFLKGTFVVE